MSTPSDSQPQEMGTPLPQAPHTYRPEYSRPDPRLKSPVIATLLSLMPGLGQVYLGYYGLGFLNIVVVASIIAILEAGAGSLEPLLGFFLAFFILYNLVDAGRRAVLLNQAITRMESIPLPQGFGAMSIQARVLSGLGLIAAGLLAIAHLRFGLPMAWLQTWWPAGLVIAGIYLVWKAVAERKE